MFLHLLQPVTKFGRCVWCYLWRNIGKLLIPLFFVLCSRMADLKRELDEVARAKDGLERLSYQLVDEIRQTKSKVETQQVEFQQNAQDFKNKSKKLEEENRQMVSSLPLPRLRAIKSIDQLLVSRYLCFSDESSKDRALKGHSSLYSNSYF